MTRRLRDWLLAALLVACRSAAAEITLHVSPQGSDAWSGQLRTPADGDGPLASLSGARDRIRTLRSGAVSEEPIRVVVADGRYTLAAELVLEPQDGGTATAPVVYEAAAGARPVFSGGRRLGGWSVHPDGTWSTRVPKIDDREWRFEQLFVNGRRATRARTPNRFWFHVAEAWEDTEAQTRVSQGVRLPADAFATLEAVPPGELAAVLMKIYHKWDLTGRFIGGIDREERAVFTTGGRMKPWNRWGRDSVVVFENARAFLDSPGEWFLDPDGTLLYLPLPGETPDTSEVIAPAIDHWIRFAGDPQQGTVVAHVTFRGLTFHHGQWLTPAQGFEPMQAVAWVDAMVMADNARNVVLEVCEFGHCGRYAAWFRRGCRDCTLRACHFFDCGAGGVRLGEAAAPAREEEATGSIRVEDCIIRHGGRIFAPAVGVWIGFSGDNVVDHNEIADFSYTGISAGWRWGYDASTAKRNRITANHIHHLGYGPLADLGGVYTLGPSEGTVVSGNVIHHVHSLSYGGWGLYPDEGSSGIVYENNLVHDTKDGSFHQHYGRDNVVRNNVFVDSVERQIVLSKAEPHRSFSFTRNVVAWRTGAALAGAWEKGVTETGDNCWWREDGGPVDFLGRSLADWQALGHERGSVVADPRFLDAARHDYRLAEDSPALARGFRPVDWSTAGVRGDAAWRTLARDFDPGPPPQPPPAPRAFDLSFEHDAVSKAPQNVGLQDGGTPTTIVVTDEFAAAGRRSVALTDRDGLSATWAPHLFINTPALTGTIRNRFALRLSERADVTYEWRDFRTKPYLTGAWLQIADGRVWVRRQGQRVPLMDVPAGVWLQFEIVGGVGSAASPTWSLTVTPPNAGPRVFSDLPAASPEFSRLTWTGLSSHGPDGSVVQFDDYRIEPLEASPATR